MSTPPLQISRPPVMQKPQNCPKSNLNTNICAAHILLAMKTHCRNKKHPYIVLKRLIMTIITTTAHIQRC